MGPCWTAENSVLQPGTGHGKRFSSFFQLFFAAILFASTSPRTYIPSGGSFFVSSLSGMGNSASSESIFSVSFSGDGVWCDFIIKFSNSYN